MWVYGDRERTESTREFLQGLIALGEEIAVAPPGLHRHSLAVEALIRAGSMAQALADSEMASSVMADNDRAAAGENRESVVQALAIVVLSAGQERLVGRDADVARRRDLVGTDAAQLHPVPQMPNVLRG